MVRHRLALDGVWARGANLRVQMVSRSPSFQLPATVLFQLLAQEQLASIRPGCGLRQLAHLSLLASEPGTPQSTVGDGPVRGDNFHCLRNVEGPRSDSG